jgi:hypothetical protein
MPIIRLFILIAIIFLVYMFVRRFKDYKTSKQRTKRRTPKIENTVKCRYCGTYLPKSEAIQSDKGYYCSQQHQLADQR